MKTIGSIFTLLILILAQFTIFAQQNGDYKSRASGKSTNKHTWQVFSNGCWKIASKALGDHSNNTVFIKSGHTVDNFTVLDFYNIYLMSFNEPDGTWTYITDPSIQLSNGLQGYGVWATSNLRGDATIEFEGTFRTGSYSSDLTRTATASHNSKGFVHLDE